MNSMATKAVFRPIARTKARPASAGGVWTALVSGFGGMRDYDGKLSFDPRLPAAWPELAFPLEWHGSQLRVSVTATELRVSVESGDAVDFTVRGAAHSAAPGADAVVALADQGPVLEGRPTVSDVARGRREDGSYITASIPPTGTIDVAAE